MEPTDEIKVRLNRQVHMALREVMVRRRQPRIGKALAKVIVQGLEATEDGRKALETVGL